MERAKALSNGKTCFSKTACGDLQRALAELSEDGPAVTKEEILDAIQAKLDLCSATDPTSYVIFGSTLAADLVASVRNKRQRKAQSAATAERERQWKKWQADLRAVRDDLTVDLDDWFTAHYELIPVAYIEDAERLFQEVEKHHGKVEMTAEEEKQFNRLLACGKSRQQIDAELTYRPYPHKTGVTAGRTT